MSASSALCLSRTRVCTPKLSRSGRGYCSSKRHRWSYDSYPKYLKHLEAGSWLSCNPGVSSPPYGRTSKGPSAFDYGSHTHKGWRSSSSWGRWNSTLDEGDRKQGSNNETKDEDSAAWTRSFERLEKDTADLYKLVKKRIDADPFDALFGYSRLYPKRTNWWSAGDRDHGLKEDQQKTDQKRESNDVEMNEARNKREDHNRASQNGSGYRHTASTAGASPSINNATLVQEYQIDPITMRKIPREPTTASSAPSAKEKATEEIVDIPVKRFKEVISQQASGKLSEADKEPESNSRGPQHSDRGPVVAQRPESPDWLAREGFAKGKQNVPTAQSTKAESGPRSSSKIESALDRGIRAQTSDTDPTRIRPSFSYEAKENKIEDVDLLRASDVRASSSLGSGIRMESEEQKHSRRQKLEEHFQTLSKETPRPPLIQKLAVLRNKIQEAKARKRRECQTALQEKEVSAQKAAMEKMEMRHAEILTGSNDIANIHPQQGEGDMASNVHEFANRERWYKRKAPHAAGLEEQKAIQPAKDISFIREIRGIYEDTYGVIDSKHHQRGTSALEIPEGPKSTTDKTSGPPVSHAKDTDGCPTEDGKVPPAKGALSVQEKIGTMLQQLLDDSRSLQKLLRTSELSPRLREELFLRNRSMRNASDAITEALSSSSTVATRASPEQATTSESQAAAKKTQEESRAFPSSTDTQKPSTVYSVLAYDPSIQQITTAEMSSPSESPSERRVSLSEELSSLTEPAKFLPHLTALQSQGYEIVSSDTNILVLKKTPKVSAPPSHPPAVVEDDAVAKEGRRRIINPIDGTTTQTGNFASPTGFVNHDSVLPPPEGEGEEGEQQPSGYRVRREEDVFSGRNSNQWQERRHESASDRLERKARYRRAVRRRHTTKRVIMTGLWTASLCYVVGVATEFLRA
ncbi:MAG: hypothetical protein Q9181_002726 [Wetmoreana brouardii]